MAIIINSPKNFCVNVVLGRRNPFEFTLQEENFHWNLNFAIWLLANLLNLNSASIRFFNIYINDSWYNWNSKIKIRWYLIPWTISILFSPFFVNGKLITKRWARDGISNILSCEWFLFNTSIYAYVDSFHVKSIYAHFDLQSTNQASTSKNSMQYNSTSKPPRTSCATDDMPLP